MLKEIYINNVSSINECAIDFYKGKYEFKEDMIYKNKIVNPIALYGSNASGKSNLLNSLKDLLMIMISDVNKISLFIPHFLNFNKNELSSIKLIFELNKKDYVYFIKTEFFKSMAIKEEYLHIMKKNNKEEVILSRHSLNYKIANDHRNYKLGGKTFSALRKIANEVSNNDDEIKTDIANAYNYLSSMVFIDANGDVISKYSLQKTIDEIILENSMKVQKILRGYHDFPIYKYIKKNAPTKLEDYNYGISLECEDTLITLPKALMSKGMLSQSTLLSILLTMDSGSLFIIDELDRSLHPLIVKQFINEVQKKDIQIIFSSHNTNLLQNLRPDQIFFAKWKKGSSNYYRLSNIYENIREVNNIEKMYLSGSFDDILNI